MYWNFSSCDNTNMTVCFIKLSKLINYLLLVWIINIIINKYFCVSRSSKYKDIVQAL